MRKFKIIFFIFYLLFHNSLLFAQNWPLVIGDNVNIIISGITEDYDKGLLLSCYLMKNSTTTKQGILIKTDINGITLWQKSLGSGEYPFGLTSVKKTASNSTLLCGATAQYDDVNYDPLFLKLDPCGEIEWCTIIHDETINWDNYGTEIIELEDGSSVGMVKYYGNQDQGYRISLVKLDPFGEPVWIQHLAQDDSTVYNEEGYDLILTTDSNYLVAGHRNGGSQPYFIMCDTMGNEEWVLSWDQADINSGSVDEVLEKDTGIFYASGGGIINFIANPFILKFDKNGNELYSATLIGDTVKGSGAGPLEVINDTTLALGIQWRVDPIPTGDGFSEIFLTDTLGNLKNRRLLVEQNRPPKNIIKTTEGKIVVIGNYHLDSNWDILIWKMNLHLEDDSLYTQPMVYDSLCPGEIVSDTIDFDCGLYVNLEEIPLKDEYQKPLKVFPNPANTKVEIHANTKKGELIRIINSTGILMLEENIPVSEKINLGISNWPKGIYFVGLYNQSKLIKTEKLIKN